MRAIAIAAVAACTMSTPARPRDGAIGGLTRDRASGDPVGYVTLRLRGTTLVTSSTREGLWGFDHLTPGRYMLDAQYGDERATVNNITVARGDVAIVEVELGSGSAVRDYAGDVLDGAIETFAPAQHDPATSRIEGTIADSNTRRRVGGATITAIAGGVTLQVISDDAGRYRFDPVAPGTYAISAYYSVSGHGQIEVRRSDIAVPAGHGVRVPLWVETQR
ncbi:MAG TPA: carboxypeptidase-like regulatory domain-containing protein [Kofleriaceae bacterium]|nr:carboxypeptidase-like regulatory domain-containing protein [Kofleriaceae bacterium]